MARLRHLTALLVLCSCTAHVDEPTSPPSADCPPAAEPTHPSKPSWLGEYAAARVLTEQAQLAAADEAHARAARLFAQASVHGQAMPSRSWFSAGFSAAEHYTAAGQSDEALGQLEAMAKQGYRWARVLQTSVELESLRGEPRFEAVLARAQENFDRYKETHADPEAATLEFSDVPRFWAAYDQAKELDQDMQWAAVLRKVYFEPATPGLADYVWLKTTSAEQLVRTVRKAAPFYEDIREHTLSAAAFEPQIRAGFRKLAQVYPDAHFPPTTFVIGRLNSGGTAGEEGMIIGLDIWSYSEGGSLEGVSTGMQGIVARMRLEHLPFIVLHEQTHAMQQYGTEPSLLRDVLMEGSADFIAQLALGQPSPMPYYAWGLTHEQRVWARFEPQMREGKYGDWMANYNRPQLEDDWHPDLGYFIGARICEAYYAQAEDKQQAIVDLLFVTDPFAILERSGYPSSLEQLAPSGQ